MKTQGIYLAWITVKNIEKAIAFYTKVVGLELKEYHEKFAWAEFAGPGGAILGIGEEDSKASIKAGTNAVVTISVENLVKAKSHFVAEGAHLIGETIEIPGEVRMQTFLDIDGNMLQLVQKLD